MVSVVVVVVVVVVVCLRVLITVVSHLLRSCSIFAGCFHLREL